MATRLMPGTSLVNKRQHGVDEAGVGRERPEQVLEALVVHRLGRGDGGDHRDAIALCDAGDDLRVARAERRHDDVHLVVGDELFGDLLRALAVALVVVGHQFDLLFLAAHIDAACRVHAGEPQIVGQRLLLAFVRQSAGQRERRADLDDVISRLSGARPRREREEKSKSGVGHGFSSSLSLLRSRDRRRTRAHRRVGRCGHPCKLEAHSHVTRSRACYARTSRTF